MPPGRSPDLHWRTALAQLRALGCRSARAFQRVRPEGRADRPAAPFARKPLLHRRRDETGTGRRADRPLCRRVALLAHRALQRDPGYGPGLPPLLRRRRLPVRTVALAAVDDQQLPTPRLPLSEDLSAASAAGRAALCPPFDRRGDPADQLE